MKTYVFTKSHISALLFGRATQHAGPWIANQRLTPGPLHWEQSLHCWTAGESHWCFSTIILAKAVKKTYSPLYVNGPAKPGTSMREHTQPQKAVNYWYVQQRGWIPEGHTLHSLSHSHSILGKAAFQWWGTDQWPSEDAGEGGHGMRGLYRELLRRQTVSHCGCGCLTLHLSSVVQYSLTCTPKGTSIAVHKF